MHMRLTSYAYPWDLARLGVERMLQGMVDDGVEAIDLAATYHPIDSMSPRDGMRLFTNARGAVYFPARVERYGRIKPLLHSAEICAAWPEAARHSQRLGLGLNAWTITLYQPWIRDTHPDCARVLPGGDASGSGVCPANEDVRDFLAVIAEDVVDQFGVELVRLESPMAAFDFDWLRPRTLVQVPPLARTLLNLCFCGSCTRKAGEAGLDVTRLRRVVNEAVDAEIADGGGEASAERAAALGADVELRAFASNYVRSSTDLVRAVASRLAGRARVSVNASVSYSLLLGEDADDVLLGEFAAAADQIAIHPGTPTNKRFCDLASSASPPREISALIPLTRATGLAGPALQARVRTPELMAQEAIALGASELSLYNYGLLGERETPDFVAAFRRGFADQAR
jgi:hypothetical protein